MITDILYIPPLGDSIETETCLLSAETGNDPEPCLFKVSILP